MAIFNTTKKGANAKSPPKSINNKKLFEMVKITKSSPISQRNGAKKETINISN